MTGAIVAVLVGYTILLSVIVLALDNRLKKLNAELEHCRQKRNQMVKAYENALKECYGIIEELRKETAK